MNNDRRRTIRQIIAALERFNLDDILNDAKNVRDAEQGYYDNMPEAFHNCYEASVVEGSVSALDSAVLNMKDAISYIRDAIDALNDALNL